MAPTVSFRLLVLMFVVALAVPSAAGDGKRTDEEVLRELKEVLWPMAYREQDVELLDRILADEFQMVSADGAWTTKADELAWVRKNRPDYASFVFTIKRLDVFENGTAVVAGQGRVEGTGEDGPWAYTYESSNILIKRDGVWRAVASHVSGVKP